MTTIPRKLFNENNGIQLLRQYILIDKQNIIEKHISSKYLAQASFNALVRYLDGFHDITFTNNCVRIKFSGSERTMQIDAETIKNLELIHNSINRTRESTLFQALDHTKTPQGARLLISNIVQPPIDINTIRMRQDAVKEVLKNERLFFSFVPILSKFDDLDKMLVKFSQKVDFKKMGIMKIQSYIKNVIQMKNSLDQLSKLTPILQKMDNSLFKALVKSLSNQAIQEVQAETMKYINEKPPAVKSNLAHTIVHSMKDDVDGLLDVCKKTYFETISDINTLLTHYQDTYKLPTLKLQQSANKGFYFSIPCKNKSLLHLPTIFTGCTYKNSKCNFVSDDLASLSRRNKEVFEEIMMLISVSVEKLTDFYRDRLSDLFNVSEAIALLDFIISLGTYVTLNENCELFYF
eukprot:gene17407-20766_t